VDRLDEAYKTLLQNHEALKTQNDEILVRVGLEQQFALAPVTKGKQMEDDVKRTGMGNGTTTRGDGDTRETVGLVGGTGR